MMRYLYMVVLSFTLFAIPAYGQTFKKSDVKMSNGLRAYVVSPQRRNQSTSQLKPILVFVHGGGWIGGFRKDIAQLDTFVERMGMILISLEYRFKPVASFKNQVNDVVKGMKWVRSNAHHYGGDASRIIMLGHSAGAHLINLAVTQQRAGKVLGVVSNDSRVYDVPKLMRYAGPLPLMYMPVFGPNPSTWRWASPVTYVRKGVKLPPFLLMYSGIGFNDRRTLTESFANELKDQGNEAYIYDGSKYNHFRIHSSCGNPQAEITGVLVQFVKNLLNRATNVAVNEYEYN